MKFIRIYTFLILIALIYSYPNYRINMTLDQISIWALTLDYIQQQTGRRCTGANLMQQQKFCSSRCDLLFYYVPTAPSKNYRYYNKTTKDCQPRTICPPILTVKYNKTINKCIDITSYDIVQGIDSSPIKSNYIQQVQFDCIHGYVGIYNGLPDCICQFGWKTSYWAAEVVNPIYPKCNKGILIYQYIPAAAQIYYDQLLDVEFPSPANPSYWTLAAIYYLQLFRNMIVSTIWPVQVQLSMLVIPEDNFIQQGQWVYIVWSCIILLMIILISLYEKIKNSTTLTEMALQAAS